jgi:hypothetical protein
MRSRCLLVWALVVLAAACRQATRELEPTPAERTDIPKIARQIPAHEPVPGSNARTALLFARPIPGMNARVEVREYYVSEGTELVVPAPAEAMFEIRSGTFDVQTKDLRGERLKGTTWSVQPNERVVVRTTSQMAVLRALSIIRQ